MSQNDIKLPVYTEESHEKSSPHVAESLLPSSKTPEAPKAKINPVYIISIWIALSSSVILQNAYLLRDLKFNYPIFLTTFHLCYATLGTRLLLRFTNLLDGLKNIDMPWDKWLKNIVPIGALFSASLIFSNLAYLTLSVSFIQMLKAFTSVAVLGMSVFMGLDKFNQRTLTVVVAISLGVALAAYGEINFALDGFLYQVFGILFEATRLVTIQKLLQGMKMDPLVSLYYYAPVCATINACLIPVYEGWAPFEVVLERVGAPFLIANASTAFLLNVAVVFLIGSASSLVLTLSGVVKDILLVVGSVVIMGSSVTFTQLIGYSIALAGLVVFKTPQDQVQVHMMRIRSMLGR